MKPEWVSERGKRVTLRATTGSASARRLREELRVAESIASAAAKLLRAPDGARLEVTLLDPAEAAEPPQPPGTAVVVVLDPDGDHSAAAVAIVRGLIAAWFGESAATAEPWVLAAAGLAAARSGSSYDLETIDAWLTEQIAAGEVARLPRESSDESDLCATSFGGFVLKRNGDEALAELFAEIAASGPERASETAFGVPLGSLEEAWAADRKPRRTRRGGAFGKLLHQTAPLLRPHWKRLLEVFVYILFGIAYGLALPLSSKYFFDTIIPDGDTHALVVFVIVLFAFYIVGAAVGVRRLFVMNLVIQRVSLALQEQLFVHLQRLPHSYHARARVGDLASRFSHDISGVQGAIDQVFESGLSQVLMAAFTIVTLLLLSPLLAVVVLATVPVFAVIYLLLRKRLQEVSVRQQMLYGDVSATIQENLSAYPMVKAFRLEEPMLGTYRLRTQNLLDALLGGVRVGALFGTSLGLAVICSELIVLGLGGYLVIQGTVSLGTLVAFLGLTPGLYGTLSGLAGIGQTVEFATGSIDRINEVLYEPVTVEDWPGAQPLDPLAREIEFDAVTFGYEPDRPILQGLDLVIPVGAKVSIVGPSGSGKSTVANLLLRFWDPDEGAVRFDNEDLRDATLASVRDQIGLVFQETFIFNTTLRENIAFGRPGASADEVVEASKAAQLHAFAEALPDGYETVLGERGVRMSGGQRQRLAIARIVLRNPAILILDEATSALDVRTEREVMVALDALAEGRTTINITHRLASAATSDLVVVLDGGAVAEQGTHEELLRSDGLYRKLWEEQAGGIVPGAGVGALESGLARMPLLAALPAEALDALAGSLQVKSYDVGETVVTQGDPGDAFYLIGRGEVEAVVDEDGTERRLRTLGEGEYFGELALLTDAPRSASVRTLLPTELYRLDRADFIALCEAEPEVLAAIQTEAAERSSGPLIAVE